jgi:hypothetical protein
MIFDERVSLAKFNHANQNFAGPSWRLTWTGGGSFGPWLKE